MWFENFDIYLHHLQPRRPVGVAPGRQRIMRDRYLELRSRQEEQRQHYERARLLRRLTGWAGSQALRLRRRLGSMPAVKKWRTAESS